VDRIISPKYMRCDPMNFWYDVVKDPISGYEYLVPYVGKHSKPSGNDFNDTYPLQWGVLGYIYVNTKHGAVMVNSSLGNLEGKSVEINIR